VKRVLKFSLSLLVTVGFGWWAFRDTNWKEQWQSLQSANYLWLIPYAGTLVGVHLCRTIRWGCLLSGIEKVSFRRLNEASGIGFMMLLLLPFRLGEFARPFLIHQRSSIRRSAAMTSVVLERIVDGILIAVVLRVLLLFMPQETTAVRWAANGMFAIFAGGLVFLLFALWHQRRAVGLVRAMLGRWAPGLADKAAGVVDAFVGAMRHLPSLGAMAGFFVLTALYWSLNAWGMSILAHAFDCPTGATGCVPLRLTFFQAWVVMGIVVVGVMIPSAPGMIGTFQAAVKVGLALFLPSAAVNGKGVAYANVLWFCQMFQQIGLGLIFLSAGNLSFRDLAGKLNRDQQAPPEPSTGP
jgi:hypothetical protein